MAPFYYPTWTDEGENILSHPHSHCCIYLAPPLSLLLPPPISMKLSQGQKLGNLRFSCKDHWNRGREQTKRSSCKGMCLMFLSVILSCFAPSWPLIIDASHVRRKVTSHVNVAVLEQCFSKCGPSTFGGPSKALLRIRKSKLFTTPRCKISSNNFEKQQQMHHFNS